MKNVLIVSGGNIDYDFAFSYVKKQQYDSIIGVDGGLEFLRAAGIYPDDIVGDFDTVSKETLDFFKENGNARIRQFRPEKDATDTQIAIELAVEKGAGSIEILGATGTRLDHVLGNIQCLFLAHDQGIPCYLVDANNKICLLSENCSIGKEQQYGEYVSLIAITEEVKGITLKGFKYPLNNHTQKYNNSLCVSNEIVEETGEISFTEGILLLIQSRD